jgi:DNA-directed RNA polymerase specialized sigma24 family protein
MFSRAIGLSGDKCKVLCIDATFGRETLESRDRWVEASIGEGNPMSDNDGFLEDLALMAQEHPIKSVTRQKALTQLIHTVLTSGQWWITNQYGLSDTIHQEILQEAKQQTLVEIFEKIDEYNPAKGSVMGWLKFLLKKRYKDERLKYLRIKKQQKNKKTRLIYTESGEDSLINLIANNPRQRVAALVHFIEEDNTRYLQREYLPGRVDINFRAIALQRLDGLTWKEIGQNWGLGEKRIERFFRQAIDKLRPYFQQHLDIEE